MPRSFLLLFFSHTELELHKVEWKKPESFFLAPSEEKSSHYPIKLAWWCAHTYTHVQQNFLCYCCAVKNKKHFFTQFDP